MSKAPNTTLSSELSSVSNEEIKKLIEENLRLTNELLEATNKIRSYVTLQKIMTFIYLVLIFGPIILGLIYLPPLFRQVIGQYSELLNPSGAGTILNEAKILNQQPSK